VVKDTGGRISLTGMKMIAIFNLVFDWLTAMSLN
jgi:hypothetical protein